MALTQDLATSVTALTAAVAALPQSGPQAGFSVSDVDVQSAVTSINAQTAILQGMASGKNPAAPQITAINPQSGQPGTAITITGSGFGAQQGSSTLTLNGVSEAVVPASWSDTQIQFNVPTGASTGNVVVTVNGQSSNANLTIA
jgi:hypothetical protein